MGAIIHPTSTLLHWGCPGAQAAMEELVGWSSGADKPNARAAWASGSRRAKGKTSDPVMEQRHCIDTAKAA